jgi:protein TonB
MASPGPRVVSVDELRFRPANSNDRARAGMEHDFKDVPPCAFARDDGISPYIGADAGIDGFPDNPAAHEPIHDDVPSVAQDGSAPTLAFGRKLLRAGFALSVFLHGLLAIGVGYATVKLPDGDALLEGETVVAVEFFSETDSEVTTRIRQEEQDSKEKAVEMPVDQPKEEPKNEVAEPVEPVEEPKPAEQAKRPEPLEQPGVADAPEVLSKTEPSSFRIEAAKIEPLPVPTMPVEKKSEPEKERPKSTEEAKKPKTKPDKKEKKKTRARDGNAETDSNKGSSKADKRNGGSRDASQGNSKRKVKGNASTSNYKGLVQRKLERAKKRVRVAARGTVIVSFTISANGGVVNLRVRKSSGKPAIDQGALDIVRRASPFPAIPDETGLTSYPVSVPMTFKGS